MKKRTLGRSGLEVSVLTFGCWQAGGGSSWTDTTDEDSLSAMLAGYESGINFYDTAEGYGDGHSETLLGRFIAEVGRENVLVASKVGAGNLAASKVKESCANSLKRLGIDTIDLYQIHWPAGTWGTPLIPIEETMKALLQLQAEGKIRAIGVSNFNGQQIEEALSFGRVDSLQPPYSLLFQPYVVDGTIETCVKHGIGVIPYSPLAQGLVTGKFGLENRPTDNRSGNVLFKDPTYPLALEAVEKLKPIAEKHQAKTAHVALAWLLEQEGVTSPIVGARTAEQIRDTARAATIQLNEDELAQISKIAKPVLDSIPPERNNPWS